MTSLFTRLPFHALLFGLAATSAACAVSGPPADRDPDDPPAPTVDAAPSAPLVALAFDTSEDTAITYGYDARDADGTMRTIAMRPPQHGTAVCDGLVCTYTPAPNFHGHESFATAMGDGDHQVVTVIDVAVASVNDAPTPQPDVFAMVADTELSVTPSWLVDNDTDVDGDVLVVAAAGTGVHGTATFERDHVSFVPDPGFTGDAGFDYEVTDGAAVVLGHATVHVAY